MLLKFVYLEVKLLEHCSVISICSLAVKMLTKVRCKGMIPIEEPCKPHQQQP
jgi:hypothetical protein